jgi:hypothetical protein
MATDNGISDKYDTAMGIWAARLETVQETYELTHPFHGVLGLLSGKKRRIQEAKLPFLFRGEPFDKQLATDPDMTLALYKAIPATGRIYSETRLEVGTVFLPGARTHLREHVAFAANVLVKFSHDDVIFGMERLQEQLLTGVPDSLAEGIDPARVASWEYSVPISTYSA